MLEMQPASLRLTATYGFVIAASVIIFGASVGRWIDRTRRITAARTFLTIQNTAVSLCAVILAGFIQWRHKIELEDLQVAVYMVSGLAIFLASIARLASSGTNIIIQKDWIVVIAEGDTDRLATMNSILRTIELTTYMLAPVVAGQLFTFLGFGVTGIVIAGWNVISVLLEYLLLSLIYRRYPNLAKKRIVFEEEREEMTKADKIQHEKEDGMGIYSKKKNSGAIMDAIDGWKLYFNHPIMKAGLGLACLFMTVLGFDNITYGYCLMQGVPHAALGPFVGVSALVGVAGSLSYPVIRRRVGLERTGLLGMFLLVSCSSFALVSIFLPGSPMDLGVLSRTNTSNTSAWEKPLTSEKPLSWSPENAITPEFWRSYCSVLIFLLGIILARFGLWIVDLTVNQLLQEKVDEEDRGVINGVQDSLNNVLDLTKCVLVIILPAQETFALLIVASFISISVGWLMYALYSRSQRGHLFHFRRLAASIVCLPNTENKTMFKENDQKEFGDEKDEEEKKIMIKAVLN